jgi:transposase InsO family protein
LASQHPVRRVCRLLGVSTSGYYRWSHEGDTARRREDRHLKQQILAAHTAGRGCYGTPRIEKSLRRGGIATSRKRVARLRRELGLKARVTRSYRRTTQSDHEHPPAPNRLQRRFEAPRPDRIWVSDITYLATDEGWLYLAVLLDTFSRRIVGWRTGTTLDRELALEALDQALETREPDEGLVHHSDRGVQYCCRDYRRRLDEVGLVASMSRAGDCWDNAMAESFFKTLKVELGRRFRTRQEAYRQLFDYIERFYNTQRLHSALGYRSPAEYERLMAAADGVAERDLDLSEEAVGSILCEARPHRDVNPQDAGVTL